MAWGWAQLIFLASYHFWMNYSFKVKGYQFSALARYIAEVSCMFLTLSGRCMLFPCAPPGSWPVPTPRRGTTWPAEAWTTSAPPTALKPARATSGSTENWLDTQVESLLFISSVILPSTSSKTGINQQNPFDLKCLLRFKVNFSII